MPALSVLWHKKRKRDIFVSSASGLPKSSANEEIDYFMCSSPELNSCSTLHKPSKELIKDTFRVRLESLTQILDKHINSQTKIDFMSIDVEGLELEILKSLDWSKYKADYICIESLSSNIANIHSSEVYSLLSAMNYTLLSKLANSYIFKLN